MFFFSTDVKVGMYNFLESYLLLGLKKGKNSEFFVALELSTPEPSFPVKTIQSMRSLPTSKQIAV